MYETHVEAEFEYGHRLAKPYPQDRKCANLHGHAGLVELHFRAFQLDSRNMVQDFDVKEPIKKILDEKLDHAMIVNIADTRLTQFLRRYHYKHYITYSNPTAEHLAYIVYELLTPLRLPIYKVVFWEGRKTSATYYPDLFVSSRHASR